MMHYRFLTLLFVIMALYTGVQAQGIVIQRRTAREYEHPPKALLIKLNSEQKRINYLKRTHNDKLLAIIEKDSREATRRLIMDFTDNFDYCPVYYFYDTSAYKIVAGDFAGALLDKDLNPAQNIILKQGDTDFVVGYYGIMAPDYIKPLTQDQKAAIDKRDEMNAGDYSRELYGTKDGENYKHHTDMNPNDPDWVVLDHNLNNVRSPIPRSYYFFVNIEKKPKQKLLKYRFVSKRANIAYKPVAIRYDATLKRFYFNYSGN